MADFDYVAVNAQGRESSGRLQAADSRAAATMLRQQGLFVVKITEAQVASGLNREINLSFGSPIKTRDMIFWFRQLSFMLRAGLPVLQALELSHSQAGNARLRQVVGKMIADIKNGSPLSQAMSNHPKVFAPLTVKLVVAGEFTGEMDAIVSRLGDYMEKKAALRAQTINAMIYPATVVLAGIGVAAFLVLKIIPQFAKFLLGRGKPLPPSTQMLVDISNFFINNGVYILAALGVGIFALVTMYNRPVGRFKLDGLILKMPVIGKLLTTGAMAQFNWSLGMLLRSGLTVLEALKIVADATGNKVISRHLEQASGHILSGRDMAASLEHPAIPKLVTQMVAVGERTGTLDAVLNEMATYYEQLLEVQIKRLSGMVEPALILVIGGMVGFVYYSFFQALFSLSKF